MSVVGVCEIGDQKLLMTT